MNDTLPPEVTEALRTLAKAFTDAANANTVTAFEALAENKACHAALDTCSNYDAQ